MLGDEHHYVVALDFVFLKAQHAFGIGTDGQTFRIFIRDMIAADKTFWGARQFYFASIEFIHRRRADQPRADAETGGGVFEQVALVFVTGKFSPTIAEDFAIDGRAHMTDDVRSHEFFQVKRMKENST